MKTKVYVGLDVHKDSISVAVLPNGRGRKALITGTIPTEEKAIRQYFGNLAKQYDLETCYEAGCLGFWLQRLLAGMKVPCLVVAPTRIPRMPGDRIKTDERDALKLALLLRSGEAESVFIPDPETEAIRDLLRTREDLRLDLVRQKHRLSKFLLRHRLVYRDGRQWTLKHDRWLRELTFLIPAQKATFEIYYVRVKESEQQLRELDRQLEVLSQTEPFSKPVALLRCFQGIDWLTALNLVVEVGDFRRFRSAGAFMSYLGLVPSEYSSGGHTTRGSITKTGSAHLRRLLAEAAWHYRHGYRQGYRLKERRAGQPVKVIAIADQAMKRLSAKFRRLDERNKPRNKIVTAVARELAGFIWATMLEAA